MSCNVKWMKVIFRFGMFLVSLINSVVEEMNKDEIIYSVIFKKVIFFVVGDVIFVVIEILFVIEYGGCVVFFCRLIVVNLFVLVWFDFFILWWVFLFIKYFLLILRECFLC